jgi:hypothetical protein
MTISEFQKLPDLEECRVVQINLTDTPINDFSKTIKFRPEKDKKKDHEHSLAFQLAK